MHKEKSSWRSETSKRASVKVALGYEYLVKAFCLHPALLENKEVFVRKQ